MRIHTLALVVLCSCLDLGSETARAEGSDLAYVRNLAARGYFDLAEAELSVMLRQDGITKEHRIDCELGLCRLASRAALQAFESRGPDWDPELILPGFETALKSLQAFCEKNAKHPDVTDAELEIGHLKLGKGDLLLAALEEGRVPAKVAAYRRLAVQAYREAQVFHASLRQKLELADDSRHVRALLMVGIALTGKGLCHPRGHGARLEILAEAKTFWEAFIWDHDGFLVGAHGYMHLGRVYAGAGDPDDALEYLRTVVGIDVVGESEAERNLLRELILTTGYHLGEFANNIKTADVWRVAIPVLVNTLEKIPDARDRRWGQRTMLELARCYLGTRDFGRAMEVAGTVRERAALVPEPWTRRTAALADGLIGEIRAEAKRMDADIPVDSGD